jgi:hypothetical protein
MSGDEILMLPPRSREARVINDDRGDAKVGNIFKLKIDSRLKGVGREDDRNVTGLRKRLRENILFTSTLHKLGRWGILVTHGITSYSLWTWHSFEEFDIKSNN